jgi:hypothetical protein
MVMVPASKAHGRESSASITPRANPGVMPSKMQYRPDNPYATAERLIAQHGNSAAGRAMQEMNDCQASGDGDCYRDWGRIYDAVAELQEPKLRPLQS